MHEGITHIELWHWAELHKRLNEQSAHPVGHTIDKPFQLCAVRTLSEPCVFPCAVHTDVLGLVFAFAHHELSDGRSHIFIGHLLSERLHHLFCQCRIDAFVEHNHFDHLLRWVIDTHITFCTRTFSTFAVCWAGSTRLRLSQVSELCCHSTRALVLSVRHDRRDDCPVHACAGSHQFDGRVQALLLELLHALLNLLQIGLCK